MDALFKEKHTLKTSKELIKALEKSNKIKSGGLADKMLKTIIKIAPEDGKGNNGLAVKLSSLKESFYKDLEEIKKDIYRQTVSREYFPKNPKKVRSFY